MYSDTRPEIHLRKANVIPYLDPAKRFHDEQLKTYDKFQARSMVYIPEYDIILPKAPAFREASAAEVKRIVGRLARPIQCQVTDYTCHRETTRQMKDMCGPCELNLTPNIVPKRELENINERLQSPTTSFLNRSRMRPLRKFDIFEINESCKKAGTRPNSMLPRRNSSVRSRPMTGRSRPITAA